MLSRPPTTRSVSRKFPAVPHLLARLAALGLDLAGLVVLGTYAAGAVFVTAVAIAAVRANHAKPTYVALGATKPNHADSGHTDSGHTDLGPDVASTKPITVDVAGLRLALSVPWARAYLDTAVSGVTLTTTSGAVIALDACQRAAFAEQVEAGVEQHERASA